MGQVPEGVRDMLVNKKTWWSFSHGMHNLVRDLTSSIFR